MKVRFSFIDLLVLIPILMFCSLLFIKNPTELQSRSVNNSSTFVEFTVESLCSEEHVDGISVGDAVADIKTGRIIGRVSRIELSDYRVMHSVLGEEAVYPETKRITITVASPAIQTNGVVTVSDVRIAVGAEYCLTTPGLRFEGNCVSMNETEADLVYPNSPMLKR